MASERSVYKSFTVPFMILGFLNIISNSTMVHILWKLKKLQTISFRLVFVQSISDICAGIVLIAFEVWLLVPLSDKQYDTVMVYSRIICDFVCQFSGTMILIIAIDRYIHMRYLNRYNTMMTNFRAAVLVMINFGSCSSMLMINCLGVMHGYYAISHLFMNFLAILMYTTTFGVYFQTYNAIANRIEHTTTQEEIRPSKRRNHNKEFAKVVAVLLSALALCYAPFVVVSTIKMSFHYKPDEYDPEILYAFYCTRLLVCSTSTLNAVLFICFNREFKSFLLRRGRSENSSATQSSHS